MQRRILIVDDNPAIHADFIKILCPSTLPSEALKNASVELFGSTTPTGRDSNQYVVDVAVSGQAGVKKVEAAHQEDQPYLVAFIDMNMPNGWNGVETIQKIWEIQPTLQIIICTAFSDFSWDQIREGLAYSDRFLILKKPFDNIEVQQLAQALTRRALAEISLLKGAVIREAAEKEIKKLAFSDPLTGLPNRRQLRERLQQAIDDCVSLSRCAALMFLDIDHFTDINNGFGHRHGDLLLIEVAKRLCDLKDQAVTVAQMGGDEFVLVIEDLGAELAGAADLAEKWIRKVKHALREPYFINGVENHITLSAGIALVDHVPVTVETLFHRADIAKSQAKEEGRSTFRFFDLEIERLAHERILMASDLRMAVERDQLSLHFQSQIDRQTGLIGAEALLRWVGPNGIPVSPTIFIPIAERTGQISILGNWVLETACRELARWSTLEHMKNLTMSVNISPLQFGATDFGDTVLGALSKFGAPADRLKLEITESMLMSDLGDIKKKMFHLKSLGIRFSIDDFGTGYSSLSYLSQLPLDQLKIDQSFVRDASENNSSAIIASAICSLGKSLGLDILAEGVETQQHYDFLVGIGCRAFQGHFFSPPTPAPTFEKFVLEYKGERLA